MPKIEDKFAATAFSADSSMPFDAVLEAADDAARRSAGVVTQVVRTKVDRDDGTIVYDVKRVGVLSVGTFVVTYEPHQDGGGDVRFVPGRWLTSQAKVLFIPVGPKDSAALKPMQTASRLLKLAVTRTG